MRSPQSRNNITFLGYEIKREVSPFPDSVINLLLPRQWEGPVEGEDLVADGVEFFLVGKLRLQLW